MTNKANVRNLSLKQWINLHGVPTVAKLLCCTEANVRHWRRGHTLPNDKTKQKIKRFSKGAVTYDTMIDGFYNGK